MALVNPSVNQAMINLANQKDSRWLTLEVCREFQRSKCSRNDQECKFAHPPPHVEVQNGRVTCCFDSIKGKCQRKEPPCKYLHPPQHLREQLLQNGRNNLIMKNLQMQMLAVNSGPMNPMPTVVPGMLPAMFEPAPKPVPYGPIWPGQIPIMPHQYLAQNPYAASMASMATHPYATMATNLPTPTSVPGLIPVSEGQILSASQIQGAMQTPVSVASVPKMARADRLEQGSMGMGMPTAPYIKRAAISDKGGIPMYAPTPSMPAAAYQQMMAMQMQHQQQQFIPVTFTGHPPGVPRF